MELLVPLTWPIESSEMQSANQQKHVPYIQLKQIYYKREILEHWSSNSLHTAIRIAMPSIALPVDERTQRDESIIKLVLYFLRNIIMISAPADLPVEWNENEVSRSATILAYHQQDVLALLLTIASNIGSDFNTQDVVLLELLFHLVKGVEIEELFRNDEDSDIKSSNDLRNLISKEADMFRSHSKNAPTRHNRFGTMIWMRSGDERVSAVSGQDVLGDTTAALDKMDKTKKWNRPKRRVKEEPSHNHFDLPVPLNKGARKHLRSFVEEFLDSGFNPLMSHVRKAIQRESPRVLELHRQQFFYVVGWFLQAEMQRRKQRKAKQLAGGSSQTAEDFGIVAGVLNQETFVLLNRTMEDQYTNKKWHELNASMRCFTQILLIVQEMAESDQEVDQEIAENIQNRIFYEETTHDRIASILRSFKDQGFGYLDACTELAYVFIRMLERYSRENLDLQVRSKRKARKKKSGQQDTGEGKPYNGDDSEAEELAEAQRTSRERKFDFDRFAHKFLSQNCVDTFVTFTTYYKELSTEQLKRAHRYFYRLAFKQEMSVVLFRMDILQLFHRMIKGTDHMSSISPMFTEWEEFVRQLFRRLVKKLQSTPELFVEALFSKIPATTYFLEHGMERETIASKPRAPAELEVKGAMTRDQQIGVAVAVLFREKMDAIDFVKKILEATAAERQSWQDEAAARAIAEESSSAAAEEPKPATAPDTVVRADSKEMRMAMFKDGKVRLLMTLAGLERRGESDDPDATWVIPSSLSAEQLRETASIVDNHCVHPTEYYGDEEPVSAKDMLKRKVPSRAARQSAFDDDDSGPDNSDFLDDIQFPAGGPTARRPDALKELKKSRRKRKRNEEVDDETLAARREARKLAEQEKRRKIKSALYVHDSDDGEDEERDQEFFRAESDLQKSHAAKVVGLMQAHSAKDAADKKRKRLDSESTARKKARQSDDDASVNTASDLEDDDDIGLPADNASSPSMQGLLGLGLGTSEHEDSDTPVSSSPHHSPLQEISPNTRAGKQIPQRRSAKGTDHIENLVNVEELESTDIDLLDAETPVLRPGKEPIVDVDDTAGAQTEEEDDDIRSRQARSGPKTRPAVLYDSDDE